MRSLPIIELTADRPTQARLAPWIHVVRLVLVGLFLVGLHRWADSRSAGSAARAPAVIDRELARSFLPAAESFEPLDDDPAVVGAVDGSGETLGWLTQTSPHADDIVGYAGPSNVLVVMDPQWTVTDVHLLRCGDTLEHLRKVESNRAFWQQFRGWKWGETADVQVDGVSGATLTSLAIAESVAWRMASASVAPSEPPPIRRSLRFPDPLQPKTLRKWFPEVHTVRQDDQAVYRATAVDAQGNRLGTVLRTGPLSDSLIGYQGPSEVILRVDDQDVVVDLMLGESFDNQPYVRYVKQEASFWKKFKQRSLQSLAQLDFDEELIDGVSGATMTSIAVAETIRDAAAAHGEHRQQVEQAALAAEAAADPPDRSLRWNWSATEITTAALGLLALVWSRSRLRGRRGPRLLWQTTALVLLALVCGNLLSVALLGGWTRGGVPWRLAPGLTTLVVIAVFAAAISKGNLYCDHLCPHGILQQWIRPRRSRRLWWPLERGLTLSAWAIIAITLIGVIVPLTSNLAWLEPFDAYVLRVAVSISLVVWLLSLLLARLKPMAYCRLACPTGKLLDYVRRDASSHRIRVVDLALALGVAVLWLV